MEMIGFAAGNSTTIMIRLIGRPDVYLDALSFLPMELGVYSYINIYDVGVETFR